MASYLTGNMAPSSPLVVQGNNMSAVVQIEPPTKPKYEQLEIDNILSSLEVIANLDQGQKLRILDKNRFAVDDRYFQSIMRYDKREDIIEFLDHLYNEIERHVHNYVAKISQKQDQDHSIDYLHKLLSRLDILIFKFANLSYIYDSDTDSKSRLTVIKDKFQIFSNNIYRKLLIR